MQGPVQVHTHTQPQPLPPCLRHDLRPCASCYAAVDSRLMESTLMHGPVTQATWEGNADVSPQDSAALSTGPSVAGWPAPSRSHRRSQLDTVGTSIGCSVSLADGVGGGRGSGDGGGGGSRGGSRGGGPPQVPLPLPVSHSTTESHLSFGEGRSVRRTPDMPSTHSTAQPHSAAALPWLDAGHSQHAQHAHATERCVLCQGPFLHEHERMRGFDLSLACAHVATA